MAGQDGTAETVACEKMPVTEKVRVAEGTYENGKPQKMAQILGSNNKGKAVILEDVIEVSFRSCSSKVVCCVLMYNCFLWAFSYIYI